MSAPAARTGLKQFLRRGGFWLVGAVAFFTSASSSWGCVPTATIWLPHQSFAAPGAQITVEGANFEQRVELRWNALDGPLLASAPNPSFSVPVTLPDAPNGLYVVVALERAPSGAIGNVARAPVQVVRETASSPDTGRAASAPNDGSHSSSSTVAALAVGLAGSVVLLGIGAVAGYRKAARRSVKAET